MAQSRKSKSRPHCEYHEMNESIAAFVESITTKFVSEEEPRRAAVLVGCGRGSDVDAASGNVGRQANGIDVVLNLNTHPRTLALFLLPPVLLEIITNSSSKSPLHAVRHAAQHPEVSAQA